MAAYKEKLLYYLIRVISYPIRFLSYPQIRTVARFLGLICFYTMHRFRKKTLSNLSLATELQLTPEQIQTVAKQSFQNLITICLEYPKLDREKRLSPHIRAINPEVAETLSNRGQGIIFFCGHLANWETLFIEGTSRMKGVAIGKPIHNQRLYQWILSIREKYGGKIITPRNALAQGAKALREGYFLGIVGDQGMPSSSYSSSFLGRRAWTSTAPALLAYKTNCPLIFASTKRVETGYLIHYSDPIWPNLKEPIEKEIIRMMDLLLHLLEEKIKQTPEEWLWQHNRWKQQTPKNVYKQFRHDAICIILPKEKELFQLIYDTLPTFKEIYPVEFISLMLPSWSQELPLIESNRIMYYDDPKELFIRDWGSKIVFNFTQDQRLSKHFTQMSAIEVIDFNKLSKLAYPFDGALAEQLKRVLCRPGSLWNNANCKK